MGSGLPPHGPLDEKSVLKNPEKPENSKIQKFKNSKQNTFHLKHLTP
jgi:hypothetical protein